MVRKVGRSKLTVRNVLLLTTVVSILPALFVIVVTGLEYGRSLEEGVQQEARRQVEGIAEIQKRSTEMLIRMLDTVAHLPAFMEGRKEEQLAFMEIFLERNPQFLNMNVTDMAGIVTVSPGLAAGTDLSDRRHIQEVLRTGYPAVGEYILARIGDIPSFSYSFPIRDRNEVMTGVLSVVYPLVGYGEVFNRLELPEGSILGVTDWQGIRLYYYPEAETNPLGVPIKGDVWAAISSDDDGGGVIRTTGSDGTGRYYAYRSLVFGEDEELYRAVVIGFPERLVTGPARVVLYRNTLLLLVAVGVAMVATVGLGRLIFTRHVSRLVRTAKAIAEGDLDARTGFGAGVAEVDLIGAAIDNLAERLTERTAERVREKEQLARSLREKELLLKEIHHRVKNNMQMILSIVHLQQNFVESADSADSADPTAIETFCRDLETRIAAIAGVHEMLYQSPDLSTIEMQLFMENLVHLVAYRHNAPEVIIRAEDIALRIETAVPLSLITAELLVNAGKYAAASSPCTVEVNLVRRGDRLVLSVDDNGPGFPEGFDVDGGKGLGFSLISALASQLK